MHTYIRFCSTRSKLLTFLDQSQSVCDWTILSLNISVQYLSMTVIDCVVTHIGEPCEPEWCSWWVHEWVFLCFCCSVFGSSSLWLSCSNICSRYCCVQRAAGFKLYWHRIMHRCTWHATLTSSQHNPSSQVWSQRGMWRKLLVITLHLLDRCILISFM